MCPGVVRCSCRISRFSAAQFAPQGSSIPSKNLLQAHGGIISHVAVVLPSIISTMIGNINMHNYIGIYVQVPVELRKKLSLSVEEEVEEEERPPPRLLTPPPRLLTPPPRVLTAGSTSY